MKRALSLVAVLVALVLAKESKAAGYYGPNPEAAPSVFTYAWRGFTLGAIDGLATGYLIARADGFHGKDWRPLVYGGGIGALVGSGVGFTLGFLDLEDDRPGTASIVLRDSNYGMGFGIVAGGITGALFMIDSEKPEHILFGASIGALAGTGVGMAIGFIEGRKITNSPAHRYPGLLLRPTVVTVEDTHRSLIWMPALEGRF
jgi:hypothetical protein